MHPPGADSSMNSSSGTRKGILFGRGSGLGMAVIAVVFLVALVFAANQNDVIGWIIALVAFGWLLLATFIVVSIRRAAKFGADQVRQAQDNMRSASGQAPSSSSSGHGSTRLVQDQPAAGANAMRDQKLDHSFKIIQVQARVVEENLGKDADAVSRALETINITAHNGKGLLGGDDGGPISGKVVD
ncbi:hypothetical protein [Arthrobacter castelli]|uniref:hypothetical protein n=1 Tax=Arthrobacter castelli TaxID=271431 RepID=UPI00047DD9FF|nr:hypothetical protein [Arthrobacter castelli]